VYVGKTASSTGGQESQAASVADSSQVKASSDVAEPVGEWCEAYMPEGYVYYWNTVTKGKTAVFCFAVSHLNCLDIVC